jgi:hypothetical protein
VEQGQHRGWDYPGVLCLEPSPRRCRGLTATLSCTHSEPQTALQADVHGAYTDRYVILHAHMPSEPSRGQCTFSKGKARRKSEVPLRLHQFNDDQIRIRQASSCRQHQGLAHAGRGHAQCLHLIYCPMSKRSHRKFEKEECQQQGCHRQAITFCDDSSCAKQLCSEHAVHWTGVFKEYTYCWQCLQRQTGIRHP